MNSPSGKPKIFVSKCLVSERCRWDGGIISDGLIKKLKGHVDIITECPEEAIGLGVPRDPIRIVLEDDKFKLQQFNTGKDLTGEMENFSKGYVEAIEEIDGFILKDRSPSCGIRSVKVYRSLEEERAIGKTDGFFSRAVVDKYGHLAVETDKRLSKSYVRENFLTRIFLSARFRELRADPNIKELIKFHADNKLLFMIYNRKETNIMGSIIDAHESNNIDKIFCEYEKHFRKALSRGSKYGRQILSHLLGVLGDSLHSRGYILYKR